MSQHLSVDAPAARGAWLGADLPEVSLSFEFFPPKSEAAAERLWDAIERLAPLRPAYVSVTCGAGGSTTSPRPGVLGLAIRRRTVIAAAAHLTCAGAPRAVLDEAARRYWGEGVRHIVALRGDPPRGTGRYRAHPDGYACAAALVQALRRIAGFEISVAGYPEAHPDSPSAAADLDNLKRKVDAGADRIITQYCFDTDIVLRFRDRAAAAGIAVPVAAGIMPIHNFAQIARFSEGCGAGVPAWLRHLFDGLDDDPATHAAVATTVAAEQCRRLVANGIHELHVYTLNRAELTLPVCRLLGSRPRVRQAAWAAA
jgi:methylenetetrahydrofolate reductase (NADPH)